jgi:NAD(P)-dependent dehydrogenase (short-subunit alcohol dehydrogenase family)
MDKRVVLYGASGHTGQFIAAEMARRGWEAVHAGRDLQKLAPVAARHRAEARRAHVFQPAEIDALLANADGVINAAGPFGDTSPFLIEAALRTGIPYFDVTAEPFVAKELFQSYHDLARTAGVVVAPAFGFFGALGDLLVSAAKGDWQTVDRIDLAFALDRWRPTNGTRLAGARRAGRRIVHTAGETRVREADEPVPRSTWTFDEPFGKQAIVGEFSTVDVVTITQHIPVQTIGTWINEAVLADLSAPDPSGPIAADDSGRSAQQFIIEAVVSSGSETRRAKASGRDIYAVTAPIVCEAMQMVIEGRGQATGVVSAGELFDPRHFLTALAPEPLSVQLG